MRTSELGHPRRQVGLLQLGVMFFTLMTAFIHIYLAVQPGEELRTWFILNGIGYIVLLISLFLPQLAAYHRPLCYTLIAYTALTIILWFIFGQPSDAIGFATKGIELILIGLLILESRRPYAGSKESPSLPVH
ncbi:hypothetical protein KTT_45660 [Tengunoibacter tsumagoiensis]|uniref:DUF2069 domain-containing protein n=2 Tax=Tengunoibacter tsumagoiensis TaxID=2014871 RepID=A0A402A6D2_9CHLR|nr:hypothetical protein KTT_45660 [Tengunoibacter tsumagoiensis]